MKDRLNKVVTDIDLYSLEVYKPGFLKSDDVNSRYRYFRLHYNEEPIDVSGLTAKAYMLKSDGKEVWNHLTIEEGLVVLEFTQQALASPGQLSVEIVLSDSNMTFELSSFILQFEVIRSLRTDASIESTNEFGVLQAFLRDLSGANEKYNTWNAKLEALYDEYTASHEAFKQTEETIVASENERIASENIRKSDESTRVANEAQRIKDENIRKASEQTRTESENTRQANETTRQNQEQTRQTQEQTRANEFAQMKRDFNALAPEQSTNAEVQLARTDAKGTKHDSLKSRLDADAKMKDTIEESKEGINLSFSDTVPAPITNIIVKGQTLQNPNNLAEIYSTGIDNGDGTFTYTVVACGNNLCNNKFKFGELNDTNGEEIVYNGNTISSEFSIANGGSTVIVTSYDNTSTYARMFEYDKNGKVITSYSISALGSTSKTLNENTRYIKLKYQGQQADIKVQLEEGTVATPYTPYQETRCDIKLPCQLDKVGNYGDSLYFSEEDNAWVVRKIFTKYTLADLNAFYPYSGQDTETVACFCSDLIPTLVKSGNIVSTRFKAGGYWNVDAEVIAVDNYNGGNRFFIKVNKSALTEVTPKGVYDYLDNLSFYVIARSNDERIVLPQSEQLKLNSFANKTHIYTISGEVDATIQATVSKSHSSATNANTKEIDKLNDKLQRVIDNKDDVEYTYKSDNGIIIAKDTNNGNMSKAVINGKTLVNVLPTLDKLVYSAGGSTAKLVPNSSGVVTGVLEHSNYYACTDEGIIKCLQPSTTYTNKGYANIVTNSADCQLCTFFVDVVEGVQKTRVIKYHKLSQGYNRIDFNEVFNTNAETTGYCGFYTSPANTVTSLDFMFMMLEGDCVSEGIPAYVDRMKSVKNDTGLSIESIDDGNLFNGAFVKKTVSGIDGTLVNGTEYLFSTADIIKVQPGMKLRYKSTGVRGFRPGTNTSVYFYDNYGKLVSRQGVTTFADIEVPSNAYGVRLTLTDFELANVDVSNYAMLVTQIGDLTKDSQVKRDAHNIFYKDETGEYLPLTELHEFDTLDLTNNVFIDNTIMVDVASGNYTITRNTAYPPTDSTLVRFDVAVDYSGSDILCDILPSLNPEDMGTTEGVRIHSGRKLFSFYIKRDKLTSADVDGFTKWATTNKPIVLLRRVVPNKYETNRMSLDVFDGAISIRTNAQNVQPDYEVTITSSINSLIGNIDDTLDSAVDDIQDIKHDLAKLTSSKEYEFSGVGSKVMTETEQGTLSELKVYGKSLVNKIPKLSSPVSLNTSNRTCELPLISPIVANTIFTLGVNVTAKKAPIRGLCVRFTFADGTEAFHVLTTGVYLQFTQFTLAKDVVSIMPYLHADEFTADDTANLTFDSIVACEGVINTIFNGIASVGNGNGIEVSSSNKNLVVECVKGFTIGGNEGSLLKKSESSTYNHIKAIAPKGEFYYKSKGTQYYVFFTDENLKILKIQKTGLTVLNNDVNASYIFTNIDNTLDYNDLIVSYDKYYTVNNIESKQDIKTILFKDTDNTWKPVTELKGIDIYKCDTIEQHSDGKHYLHIKTNKKVLNGSDTENWGTIGGIQNQVNTIAFALTIDDGKDCPINNLNIINDRFPCVPNSSESHIDKELLAPINTNIMVACVRILKTKLETQDTKGFKKWLQNNPITIVYELSKEKTYEINPLLTQVFDDSTMLQITGGPILAEFKAKCIASYSRRIESIESRLDRVEENVFKVIDNIQATVAQAEMANYAYAVNVASVQDAQDRMLMESDMRLMQVEMMLSAEPASTKTITYTSVDAKGGAVVMTSTYYEFISHMIERGTHDKAFIAKYIDMCEQTGRLTKEEAEQLKTELNPPAIEQA